MLKLLLAAVIGLSPLLGAYISILIFPKEIYPGWNKATYFCAAVWGVYLFIVNMK